MSPKPDLIDFFFRHVVALTLHVRRKDGIELGDAFTCFVLSVQDQWYLATAGHILRRLQEIQGDRSLTILSWGLFDAWSPRSGGNTKIPFNLDEVQTSAIDEDGLDMGLIELPALLRRTLAANGIEALNERTWLSVPEVLDAYYLFGLPQESFELVHFGSALEHLKIHQTMIRVVKCDPPEEMVKPYPRFYGRIAEELRAPDGSTLDDIGGMSGGPILGFQIKQKPGSLPEVRYYLVAIQSGWRKDLRVIAGTPATVLGTAVALAMAQGEPAEK